MGQEFFGLLDTYRNPRVVSSVIKANRTLVIENIYYQKRSNPCKASKLGKRESP